MKKKKTNPELPFKYNLEQLFTLDRRGEFSPELLFLAYFGDLPSAYSLQRFNKEQIRHLLKSNYSTNIIKTIKHEILYIGGRSNSDGAIYIFKDQILIKMEGILTTIYYSEVSQEFAKKLVEEMSQCVWDKEKYLPMEFLHDNID